MDTDPRFGTFAKVHREFFDALDADGWQELVGYTGVEEKILSGAFDRENQSGAVTRLARWAAGAAVSQTITHAWCEEVFLIRGSLSIGTPGGEHTTLSAGSYAVRPAGIPHGPFFSKDGCLLIEFSYYPPGNTL